MARYDHLPIWKDAVSLAALLEEAMRNFPRYHKYALGADLQHSQCGLAPSHVSIFQAASPQESDMSRPVSTLAALLIALVSLAIGPQAQATCTAANPNPNVTESTPTSAFTDNGNGTVTHSLTGLMWKQCAQGQSGANCSTGSTTTMTWSAALAAAKNEVFAGHSDWRLPNKKELESIVETCGYNPSINQTLFPATPASYFWSGSSYVPVPSGAWYVDFGDGSPAAYGKAAAFPVRLVRGGQLFDSFDATGLIFANGFE